MDPETKTLLEKTLALTEENNEILRGIRRSMRTARIMTFIYWFVIIGSAVGAFIVIEPYMNDLMGIYSGAGDVLKNFPQTAE